jgi:hypothetical protein
MREQYGDPILDCGMRIAELKTDSKNNSSFPDKRESNNGILALKGARNIVKRNIQIRHSCESRNPGFLNSSEFAFSRE